MCFKDNLSPLPLHRDYLSVVSFMPFSLQPVAAIRPRLQAAVFIGLYFGLIYLVFTCSKFHLSPCVFVWFAVTVRRRVPVQL